MAKIPMDELTYFYQEASKCFWIHYFLQERNRIGDKWVNFEEEIENVFKQVFVHPYKYELIDFANIPNQLVSDFCFHNYSRSLYRKDFESLFYEEFSSLTRLINRYMGYVDTLDVQPLSYFKNHKYEKVLTFNYTHTFERSYGHDNLSICHIHGEIDEGIVLGFDDYYFLTAT